MALLDCRVVEAVNACPEKNTSLFGLIAWMGFRQGTVEYRRQERRSGSSKWNFRSRAQLALDWIVGFSGLPLRLMTVVGAGVSLVGLIYAIHIVRNLFAGNPPEGWSSTMIVILVIGGLQMAMLGIIGEYLWKNLDESRRRPLFFIEKSTFDATPHTQEGGQAIDPERRKPIA